MNHQPQYYVYHQGQQYGPMAWEGVFANNFPPEAYIWTQGMSNWQPLGSYLSQAPQPEPVYSPPQHPSQATGHTLPYAHFGHRLAAYLIDIIIVNVGAFILGGIYGVIMITLAYSNYALYMFGAYLLGIVLVWLYFALFESGESQATPGKMILGLKVVDQQHQRITFGQATGRFFGKFISSIILFIGYLMVLWTPRRQALHDQMADTLVLKVK